MRRVKVAILEDSFAKGDDIIILKLVCLTGGQPREGIVDIGAMMALRVRDNDISCMEPSNRSMCPRYDGTRCQVGTLGGSAVCLSIDGVPANGDRVD